MKLNSTASLLLAALLFAPAAALASPFHRHDGDRVHPTSASPSRPERPYGRPSPHGRYELRPVQQRVEGYNEQVWVPETCETRRRHHRTRTVCRDGYYEQRWVPARYETVEQWVWVPAPRPRGQVQVSFNF